MTGFRIPDQFRPDFDRAVTSLPPEPVDTDADHAVAIERERIAAWLERDVRIEVRHDEYVGALHRTRSTYEPPTRIIDAIRNGEHWKQA